MGKRGRLGGRGRSRYWEVRSQRNKDASTTYLPLRIPGHQMNREHRERRKKCRGDLTVQVPPSSKASFALKRKKKWVGSQERFSWPLPFLSNPFLPFFHAPEQQF